MKTGTYAYICKLNLADMAKLVDVPDLGSGAERRVGSSPIIRTKPLAIKKLGAYFLFLNSNCKHPIVASQKF